MSIFETIVWSAIASLAVSLPTYFRAKQVRRQAFAALDESKRINARTQYALKLAESLCEKMETGSAEGEKVRSQIRTSYTQKAPQRRSDDSLYESVPSHAMTAGIGAAAGYYFADSGDSSPSSSSSSCDSWGGGFDCGGGDC